MSRFYREKKIQCSKRFIEVDIYPYTKNQRRTSMSKRRRRFKVTAPAQKNLNDKNARRYLTQLANTNFTEQDLHVTCTYNKSTLPNSVKEAERAARNYIRRLAYRMKKEGLPTLKYILVSEYGKKKDSDKIIRIHHHIIINGLLDRDTVESLWGKGTVNADRLQLDENGLAALCEYLTKNPNGKRRWTTSQNLEKPYFTKNDSKYSSRKIEKAAMNFDPEYWVKKYPGYRLNSEFGYEAKYNDLTGWHVYLKLHKIE